ncbi:MAG: rod shape-determining protein RodA [bacterium]|nr:rod shape-determining protein RodA [bacterium]
MFDLRLLRRLDWIMVLALALLLGVGVLALNSTAQARPAIHPLVGKQIIWIAAGFVFMCLAALIDYRALARWHRQIYWINIALLVAVLVLGHSSKGAQRWIPLGPFMLQPSEICKLAVIVTLAVYLSSLKTDITDPSSFMGALGHIALPMLLIAIQPDLGTALVLMAVLGGMLLVSGAGVRHLATSAGVLLALFPLAWRYGLREYQKRRLTSFIDPQADPLGTSYQLNQSKIAIGSGRMFGQGLFHGSQKKLSFIPEQHTDFIFTVIGEELGFIGGLGLLALYGVVLWRGFLIMAESEDTLGVLMVTGILSMLAFHILVNLGMTMGIMPTTGVPLPFISYGGSAMITDMTAVGLLLGIGMRRSKLMFF